MWQEFTHIDESGSRPYFVYTPEHYWPGKKVPLLVMLHGCTQVAGDFAKGTAMNELAEQNEFIVLYPQQTKQHNASRCWNWFSSEHQERGKGEPASITGMIQTVCARTELWTIDPQRIYVAGVSAGGGMAVIMGATYPDLIAAIGVHSGIEYQGARNVISSVRAIRDGGPDPLLQGKKAYEAMGRHARVVPTIVFHGTNDKFAGPINGDQVVQQWMRTDHLASGGEYVARFDEPSKLVLGQTPGGYPYQVSTWTLPDGDEVQAYWKVDGMGHVWSGGDPRGSYTDPSGPNASLAMYRFFMAHPLSRVSLEVTKRTTPLRRWSLHQRLGKLFSQWNPRRLLRKLVSHLRARIGR